MTSKTFLDYPKVKQTYLVVAVWVRQRFACDTAGKKMLTLLKLLAGVAIALGILSPGLSPRADTCECKAKAAMPQPVPRADTCECKAHSSH